SLSVSRKYFLIQEGKTWSDAQAYCKANYHDLAIIQNKDDVVQIQNEIRGKQFKSSAWIGLYMDISWSWSLGNVPLGSFIAWSFPPPDYDCAVIYPRGWIDTPCSARFPVVCFDETKTGNGRYIFVPATMVWLDAQKYCRQHYTDLASSRDATENSVIMNLVPDWTWFGLFRNSWKWIDKTVFSTWKSGNPNNALKDKNCGYLNNSLADNGLCTNIMPFICYVGFAPLILSVPRKYFLIQEGKTWSDAQAYCKANYTDLAIIQNTDDVVQIQNEIQGKQFKSSAWIGLYNDNNSWRWSLGNVPLGSFNDWYYSQPQNEDGNDECAVIWGMGWLDCPCNYLVSFVCFDETKTGNERYIYVPDTMVWLDAQSYCRQHYTDLASSRDATENSVIGDLVTDWTWFGLFRDGWKWVDQTVFSTITWMPGNPNNALKHENCGYL
ncbi:hypothetical protein HF521_022020, partial [Silurus meridionalis]